MTSFKRYADWIQNSNEAGIYREAFELADKMALEIRGAVIEAIYQKSATHWREVKARD